MKDIIRALKTLLQQYEVAYLALEKIANPNFPMRMVEAQRALGKIKKLATKKAEQKD